MAKLRSYNQQFLIAAALIANVFNDIIIQRRKHLQTRDYSKPINIKDIFQKNIQVPCIFGDRSLILKSLQNHQGAVKLPLLVLQNNNIAVDKNRIADMHVDMLYQNDEQFSKLDKDDKLYKPYDLRKRRPIPVTIQYQLTLLAKYKEDLDQLITNWLVNFRPDIYVKWWHPRDKKYPLQSQINFGQTINYKKPQQQPTTRFQYQGTANFTFKSWVFSGLDYEQDGYRTDDGELIKYFNWFPTDINQNGVQGTPGYPTIGEIGATPAGFFAVPNNQEFFNDGSDQKGIKKGKYFINNLVKYPKQLAPSGAHIDLSTCADIFTKDYKQAGPDWNMYQGQCQFDRISNERAAIKVLYFQNGFPLSCMLTNGIPSGDYLFQHFCSQGNTKIDRYSGFNGVIQEQLFGSCFTQSMEPKIYYNFEEKNIVISGSVKNQRYTMNISTKSSQNGITEFVQIKNIPSNMLNKNIGIYLSRSLDKDFNVIQNQKKNITSNITILNNTKFKKKTTPILFTCQTDDTRKKLISLKDIIIQSWDQIELYPCNRKLKKFTEQELQKKQIQYYGLYSDNSTFNEFIKSNKHLSDLQLFKVREQIKYNDIEYTLICNNKLYFVFSDEEIYDWGILHFPRFETKCNPVFKVDIKQAGLIYGMSMDFNLAVVR